MSFQADEHTGHCLGKYELLCRMAVGGMAEIFLGFSRAGVWAGKAVVLKRMLADHEEDTEALELLLQEAKLMAGLNHPNAVRVLDLEVTEENVCLVMEFIPGLNLEELVGHFKEPLPLGLTLAVLRGAALGLNHAHNYCGEKGQPAPIVHRDVTPRNIILSFDGRSKVLDFGIARIVGERRRTAEGMVRGTSSYMSPEQATDQPIDIRTDIFSLGVIFHELLTGERLFARGKPLQDMMAVFQGAISLPSQTNRKLPRSIDNLVLRMLERSVEKRFQNMGSFVERLDKDFATIVWTEAECSKFMQKHFSKRRSDIESMLSMIDVSIAPSVLSQRRPFEDARTIIESRSSNRQKSFFNKEYDQEVTALIDEHGNPWGVPPKTGDTARAVSASAPAMIHSRADDFTTEEETFFLRSPDVSAPKEAETPEVKNEGETIREKTAFLVGFLEVFKRGDVSSLYWRLLGIILIGFALGIGWWSGNKGYLRRLAEEKQTGVPAQVQEEKHSTESGDGVEKTP